MFLPISKHRWEKWVKGHRRIFNWHRLQGAWILDVILFGVFDIASQIISNYWRNLKECFFLNVMVSSGKISSTFRRKKGKFDNQVFIETKITVLCGKRSREWNATWNCSTLLDRTWICVSFFCTFLPIMTCNCLSKLITLHQRHKLESRRFDYFPALFSSLCCIVCNTGP